MRDAGGRQVRHLENQIADLRNQLENERARGEEQVWMMVHSKKHSLVPTCSAMRYSHQEGNMSKTFLVLKHGLMNCFLRIVCP